MKQYIPTFALVAKVLVILVIDSKLGLSAKIAARLPG